VAVVKTHLHTNSTQNNTIDRGGGDTAQLTNLEECRPCPLFASFTLAFAVQLRKKHGKTSVRVARECQVVIIFGCEKSVINVCYLLLILSQ
jgi:hypothetical protein